MKALRILLADDHALVRHGFRLILEGEQAWSVVAEAGDGQEAIEGVREFRPDVAVLDIAMPQINGVEATRRIRAEHPSTRVLVLSMHASGPYVTQAMRAGASGYLLKDSAGTDLVRAVSDVASGRSFLSPAAANALGAANDHPKVHDVSTDRFETLSRREREVMRLIAEGRSNKEIATRLEISLGTVETHRAHLMEKLDLHSALEIAVYALRRGLIT